MTSIFEGLSPLKTRPKFSIKTRGAHLGSRYIIPEGWPLAHWPAFGQRPSQHPRHDGRRQQRHGRHLWDEGEIHEGEVPVGRVFLSKFFGGLRTYGMRHKCFLCTYVKNAKQTQI